MPFSPYGMPGGGVSINIQKDDSASEIVKKALGEEWAKSRKTPSSTAARQDEADEVDHSRTTQRSLGNAFEDNERAIEDSPRGRPSDSFDGDRFGSDLDHHQAGLLHQTFGGGTIKGNRGSDAPEFDDFGTHERDEDGLENVSTHDSDTVPSITPRALPALPELSSEMNREWDSLKPISPRGPRGGSGREGDVLHFKETVGQAADGMLNTANVVREESEKASDHLLTLHTKIQDWHQSVKEQTNELDALQRNIGRLWSAAIDTLHEHDQKRMARFNSLVENKYGGTDCVGQFCDEEFNPDVDE
jgi:hypothetical protein